MGFLMLQTIADDIWGRPCLAHHVQPHLSHKTQLALAEVQKPLQALWPAPLHLGAPDTLHITLYAFALVRENFDKDGYWSRIAASCQDLMESFCAGHGPLELHFSRLKVTDTAIIAVATEESGLIAAIRDRIADRIPLPSGRTEPLRYDLIHTTLARYQTASSIPQDIVDAVESIPVSIRAPIERMKVIRETLFPCQVRDELQSFPLA